MNGREWLSRFFEAIDDIYEKRDTIKSDWTNSKWTTFLGEVLDKVADKMNCYVQQRRPDNKDESGEYLNIDGLFVDNDAYDSIPYKYNKDPLVLPRVAVELENDPSRDKIAYCLWKTMCIRTPIKVLICYQSNAENVALLKAYLEKVMGNLMNETDADVIIIIGNESAGENAVWKDYYTAFEWQKDRFETI